MPSYILLESGYEVTLETAAGHLLLETSTPPAAGFLNVLVVVSVV